MEPDTGFTRPEMADRSVDFPAPFVPSSATISPRETWKSTPNNTFVLSYATPRSRTTSNASSGAAEHADREHQHVLRRVADRARDLVLVEQVETAGHTGDEAGERKRRELRPHWTDPVGLGGARVVSGRDQHTPCPRAAQAPHAC